MTRSGLGLCAMVGVGISGFESSCSTRKLNSNYSRPSFTSFTSEIVRPEMKENGRNYLRLLINFLVSINCQMMLLIV